MCYDWPQTHLAKLTLNSNDTNIWAVPMSSINFKSIQKIKESTDGRKYNRVIAFKPTGWTFSGHGGNKNTNKNMQYQPKQDSHVNNKIRSNNSGDVVYEVSYSEHSSYDELIDFVDIFKYV
jgi:hypothetical protein